MDLRRIGSVLVADIIVGGEAHGKQVRSLVAPELFSRQGAFRETLHQFVAERAGVHGGIELAQILRHGVVEPGSAAILIGRAAAIEILGPTGKVGEIIRAADEAAGGGIEPISAVGHVARR